LQKSIFKLLAVPDFDKRSIVRATSITGALINNTPSS
jgi:hypothetical protein